MTAIIWDDAQNRLYETGIDHVVLYKPNQSGVYSTGVAWNGVTALNENPSGADPTDLWADNIKYLSIRAAEQFGFGIEAYTYPDEWMECDGSAEPIPGVIIGMQTRKTFGLSYRTIIGNDILDNDYGYKLHLVYGATASPSAKNYQTVNDSPEAITFSWDCTTTPINVTNYKPTSYLSVNSTKVDTAKLKALEAILYGVDAPDFSSTATYPAGSYVAHENKVYTNAAAITTAGEWNASNWTEIANPGPRLPLPDEVFTILGTGA